MSIRSVVTGLRDSTRVVEAGGVEIEVGQAGADKVRWRADSENKSLRRFVDAVDRDTVCWDVGAALGLHACVAARLGATVVAIEPHPVLIPHLSRNLRLNAEGPSPAVVSTALSKRSGTLALSHGAGVDVSEGQIQALEGAGELLVPAVRGDELVRNGLPLPDVVKIDVEGAERRVVAGMRNALNSGFVHTVFSEQHLDVPGGRRASSGAYLHDLEEFGYSHEVVSERGGEERHVVSRWSV